MEVPTTGKEATVKIPLNDQESHRVLELKGPKKSSHLLTYIIIEHLHCVWHCAYAQQNRFGEVK